MGDRYLERELFATFWARLKRILAGKVSSVNGQGPDEEGDVSLTAGDVDAYPADGIRAAAIAVAVGDWTGSGPYTAVIARADVTAGTDCRWLLDAQDGLTADIAWSTGPGQITLTTATRPAAALSGTVILTETEPDTSSDAAWYPADGIRCMPVTVTVDMWTGDGPYTVAIARSDVTAKTDCRFELGTTAANLAADLVWTTEPGQIVLTAEAKPAGTIAGTVTMTEVMG